MVLKTKIVKVPLYFQKIKIVLYDDIENKDHAAYVELKKDIEIHIDTRATAGIIAHEAVHIVNFIFKRAYIDLDIDNDEPYAYLMGWVVEQISEQVNKISE